MASRLTGMKHWLKRITLFPLSILMGIPGEDGGSSDEGFDAAALADIAGPADARPLSERIMAFAGNPNAQHMSTEIPDAAASEAEDDQGADPDGNQDEEGEETDEGLDTQSDEDDPDADQDEVEEDELVQKGTKKRSLEERATEIAQKIVEKAMAVRDQAAQGEKPDFTVVSQEKIDAHIADIEAQIDELRMEGKHGEARKLSRSLDQLDKDLEENEARRLAWETRQSTKKVESDTGAQARLELDNAADLYRSELKIEPATWDKMGQWFESEISKSKLLVEEFNDVYAKHGKVAAIRFAHEYTVKNMGRKVKESNLKKEQLKNKTAQLTTSTTGKVGPIDLAKAKREFDANPTQEAFVKYQGIKRRASAA